MPRRSIEQWASSLVPGLTVNYQAVGSGAGITSLETKTVDFGASDPPLKPADEAAIAKNGSPAVQIPMFLGAITVSYNLPGVKTGLKLEGKTIADIYPRQDQNLERPRDQGAEPWRDAAEHRDHGHPPLGLLGHDLRLHELPGRRRPRIQEQGRRRQGRAVADGHGREGQRRAWPARSSRRSARSATSSRPTRSQHNFTYASVKNKAGSFVAPTLASTSAAGEGVTVPANLGIKVINSPSRSAYPITSQTFIVVNKDLCKAGIPGGESAAKGVVKFLDYGLGQGQSILSQADYAALPAVDPRQVQGSRGRACSATARRSAADSVGRHAIR